MIARFKAWLHSRKLDKLIAISELGLPGVLLSTSIQREAHEQYSLGSCTCSVMRDKAELKERMDRLDRVDPLYEAMKKMKAQEAWLNT